MAFTFENCVESVKYFVNSELNTFENAEIACQSEGGQLAIPASSDRHSQIISAYEAVFSENVRVKAYLGLQDKDNVGGSSGTRFVTADRQINAFSFVGQGEGPWGSGQPANISDQNCVALSENAVEIENIGCNELLASICELYCDIPTFNSFGECVDNIQLYMASDNIATSFDEAEARCKSFDSTGHLAVPIDSDSFERIQSFYTNNRAFTNRDAYIGIRDFQDVGAGGGKTSRFVSVFTGIAETFTNGTVGKPPWQNGQPNDNNGNDNCVHLHQDSPHLLIDVACGINNLYICQRPCEFIPTATPSANPTAPKGKLVLSNIEIVGSSIGGAFLLVIILGLALAFRRYSNTLILRNAPNESDLNEIATEVEEETSRFKFDCFLSHCWGKKQATHKRVKTIAKRLKTAGISVWIDEEQLDSNVPIQMKEGIDNSAVFIAFITQEYIDCSGDVNRNDGKEYLYASQKYPTRIIPVLLDKGLANPNDWNGQLAFDLSHQLYEDFSSESKVQENFIKLCKRIKKLARNQE